MIALNIENDTVYDAHNLFVSMPEEQQKEIIMIMQAYNAPCPDKAAERRMEFKAY